MATPETPQFDSSSFADRMATPAEADLAGWEAERQELLGYIAKYGQDEVLQNMLEQVTAEVELAKQIYSAPDDKTKTALTQRLDNLLLDPSNLDLTMRYNNWLSKHGLGGEGALQRGFLDGFGAVCYISYANIYDEKCSRVSQAYFTLHLSR